MKDIKPCPFCGSKAEITYNYLGQCIIYCTNEDCSARIFDRDKTQITKKWNRRESTK